MEYTQALNLALEAKAALAPFCERIEIAGSIRREKPEVGDIELVAIPKKESHQLDLLTTHMVPVAGFIDTVNRWEKVKGGPTGKYTQRILPGGMKLDLFIASPENWGLIFAIRTGSAQYSQEVLATGWVRRGFHSHEGILMKGGNRYLIHEERELYELIGEPWIEPRLRIK